MNKNIQKEEFAVDAGPTPQRQPRLLDRMAQLFGRMRDRYLLTRLERQLRSHYANPVRPADGAPVVTIQCVENLFYFCLFGEVLHSVRTRHAMRVEQIIIRSLVMQDSAPRDRSRLQMLVRGVLVRLHTNRVTDDKWVRLFNAYADGIAYRSAQKLSRRQERQIAQEADVLWRAAKTKDDIVAMRAHGIEIGDLVADTYLRFRPSPELRPEDPYMRQIIEQALREMHKADEYFSRVRPALFLTSYTSYVQHGVPARVAAHLGIRVQSFGNYQDFTKRITTESSCHQRQFDDYRENFLALDDQAEKIAAADARLAARISGSIDEVVATMKSSTYGANTASIPDITGAVIVFLHDFYDSPHAYQWMVFHDFWEWVCFTIEALREKNIPFFLKPHPNQVAASAADFERLKQMYPGLDILPPTVSNRQLVESGMSCAATVYGTVTSEMAFMGIPSINCGDNPHISFDFGLTAHTKDEYKQLLQNHANLPREGNRMRWEAAAFYYMHILNLPAPQASIRDKFVRLNLLTADANQQHLWSAEELISGFGSIGADEGFHQFIDDIVGTLKAQA